MHMTVRALIAILQTRNQDAVVIVHGDKEGRPLPVQHVIDTTDVARDKWLEAIEDENGEETEVPAVLIDLD